MAGQVAKRDSSQIVKPENRVQRFVRETIAELRKVVWPTREEALRLTGIVLLVVVAMAAFLGGIDFVLSQLVQLVLHP